VIVREARAGDAAAIAGVHVRTWQAAYADVFPSEALASIDLDRRTAYWAGELERAALGAAIIVAEAEGSIVGFASVGAARGDDEHGLGELYAIYVLPESWGSGAGGALMERSLDALRAAAFEEAILWVLDRNPRARRFYEKWGWGDDGGRKRDTFFGVAVTEVRYRTALSAAT
jgi:GNAT superfamily N-acetyltransferase